MRLLPSIVAVVLLATTASSSGAQQRPSAAAPDSARLSRARLSQILGGSAIRVVRASGVTDLAATAPSVTIARGDFVFRKMADTAVKVSGGRSPASESPVPMVRGADTYAMPYRWLTVDSAGVEHVLMPYFILVGGRLTYDPGSRTYRGTALVGVEDTLHRNEGPVVLVRPLKLQLTTTSAGSVSPVTLAIGHTSLDYDSVRITSPDSTHVRIRTGADPAGIIIPIPVHDITLGLTPQQTSIQGFGLATTDISVALPRGLARTDSVSVTFSSSSAPVRPSKVIVTGAEGASVRLRSGQLGPNRIDAFIDGVPAGSTTVTSQPPIAFTVATLIGLLLGGLARFYGAKRRKKGKAFVQDVLKGAPFGIIAAVASAIGLDLLQLKIDEGNALPAIVITAALGAWAGTKLLDRSPTA